MDGIGRAVLARDFVEISKGGRRFRFAIVLGRPVEDRLLACLRYVQEGRGWRKVSSREAHHLLETLLPELLFRPRAIGRRVCGLIPSRIERHFSAQARLQEIVSAPASPLEERVGVLLELLQLDPAGIGITGSLLVGLQTDRSDIDLLFYRREAFARARSKLRQALEAGRIAEPDWWTCYRRRGCFLPFDRYLWHERRKFTKGAFRGTKFDLLLVEPAAERAAFEGGPWRSAGTVQLEANVTWADGFAFPARYRIDHPEVSEILVFSATYFGQAWPGEPVRVRGRLEVSRSGKRRIIVGSSREAEGEFLEVERERAAPAASGLER